MKTNFEKRVVENILKIMKDRNLTQATTASYMGTSPSQLSKILKGGVGLDFDKIEKLATSLSMREIDIITYPDVYVEQSKKDTVPVEAVLQLKLNGEKRDKVLGVVFGEKNVEILNA